jgi:hypothetical protein
LHQEIHGADDPQGAAGGRCAFLSARPWTARGRR